MKEIFVDIEYNIGSNKFDVKTNAKDPHEIVSTFLGNQVGKGADDTPPAELDVYHITIKLDLSCDTFTCKHDCVNKGLRDGILLHYLKIGA